MSEIVVLPIPKRPSGWQTQVVCYLNDSIEPLATDSIRWSFITDDGVNASVGSDWGFTGCCTIPAGERVRVVCDHTRITGEKHTYTTAYIVSDIGESEIVNEPTEPIRIDEPGTVVFSGWIHDDDSPQCILVNAPGVAIVGANVGGTSGIQLTEKAHGTIIVDSASTKTRAYSLHFRKSGTVRGVVCVNNHFSESSNESVIRATGSVKNLAIVSGSATNNRSKQAIKLSGTCEYANIHRVAINDGGFGTGNFQPDHMTRHVRVDRCTLMGDNDAGRSETGGDSLCTIKPNAADTVICSNLMVSDVARLRTITTPGKANTHPDPNAWPFGDTLIAHNTIVTPANQGRSVPGCPMAHRQEQSLPRGTTSSTASPTPKPGSLRPAYGSTTGGTRCPRTPYRDANSPCRSPNQPTQEPPVHDPDSRNPDRAPAHHHANRTHRPDPAGNPLLGHGGGPTDARP